MNRDTFKAIRQKLELSQHEYAEVLGVSPSTVSMVEAGKRNITERLTGKVALLDVDMNEINEYIDRMNNLTNR